ncbi:MAG: hypothetical protein ACK40G_07325 [Cytophagaceae bacterium]
MSKVYFVIGLIVIALLIAAGMGTGVVNLVEGAMLVAVIAIASPFIYKFLQRTRRHDER